VGERLYRRSGAAGWAIDLKLEIARHPYQQENYLPLFKPGGSGA